MVETNASVSHESSYPMVLMASSLISSASLAMSSITASATVITILFLLMPERAQTTKIIETLKQSQSRTARGHFDPLILQ